MLDNIFLVVLLLVLIYVIIQLLNPSNKIVVFLLPSSNISFDFVVNESTRKYTSVVGHLNAKFATVFNNVMYVPPNLGSLIFAKSPTCPKNIAVAMIEIAIYNTIIAI